MTQRTAKVRNRALVAVVATALSAPPSARAQNVDDAGEPTKAQAEPAPFSMVRYLEDRLARAGAPRDPWKDVELLDGLRVSFGGQHRLRYEYIETASADGQGEASLQSVMLMRNLLHAHVHLGEVASAFVQVGSHLAFGDPNREQPPDVDQLDLQQAFVEVDARKGDVTLTARVGRQELPLGTGRWVALREGANVRLSFDAARLSFEHERVHGEAFLGTVPALARGIFDDAPDDSRRIAGTMWRFDILPKELKLDVGVVALRRDGLSLSGPLVVDDRYTGVAALLVKAPTLTEFHLHGLAQTGTAGSKAIVAGAVAAAVWQGFPAPFEPVRVGVRGDLMSGDTDPTDDTLGTFDPLFPNPSFFSNLPVVFPTNLASVHPLAQLALGPVQVEAGWTFFWRASLEDAVYTLPGRVLVPASASAERFTGSQASASVGFRASRFLRFDAEFSHFDAGRTVEAGGSGNVNFFGAWTTVTW